MEACNLRLENASHHFVHSGTVSMFQDVSDGLAKVRIHLLQLSAGLLEIRAVHTILLLAPLFVSKMMSGVIKAPAGAWANLPPLKLMARSWAIWKTVFGFMRSCESGVLGSVAAIRACNEWPRPDARPPNTPYIGATLFDMASIMLVQKP